MTQGPRQYRHIKRWEIMLRALIVWAYECYFRKLKRRCFGKGDEKWKLEGGQALTWFTFNTFLYRQTLLSTQRNVPPHFIRTDTFWMPKEPKPTVTSASSNSAPTGRDSNGFVKSYTIFFFFLVCDDDLRHFQIGPVRRSGWNRNEKATKWRRQSKNE